MVKEENKQETVKVHPPTYGGKIVETPLVVIERHSRTEPQRDDLIDSCKLFWEIFARSTGSCPTTF